MPPTMDSANANGDGGRGDSLWTLREAFNTFCWRAVLGPCIDFELETRLSNQLNKINPQNAGMRLSQRRLGKGRGRTLAPLISTRIISVDLPPICSLNSTLICSSKSTLIHSLNLSLICSLIFTLISSLISTLISSLFFTLISSLFFTRISSLILTRIYSLIYFTLMFSLFFH